MHLKRLEMQLPQHIIDLVGSLFDEGMDDETIFRAVIEAWKQRMGNPRQTADFGDLTGTSRRCPAVVIPENASGMPG